MPYRAGPGSSGKQSLAMRAAIRGPTSACCTPWLLHVVCLAVKGETFLPSLGPAGRLREPRMLPPWISLSRAKLATSGESSHGRHVALPQAMRAGVEGSRADRPNLATGSALGYHPSTHPGKCQEKVFSFSCPQKFDENTVASSGAGSERPGLGAMISSASRPCLHRLSRKMA